MSNTGKVYGTLYLTLQDGKTGNIDIGGKKYIDEYDYKMDGRIMRDIATWIGRPGEQDDGKDYFILGYGQAKVKIN